MRFLWGTQAEADVGTVLVVGLVLVLVCLVMLVACAATGTPTGGL